MKTEKQIIQELLDKGYSNATAVYHGKKLFNEQFGADKDKYSKETKEWAYAHGFLAEEVISLGINDNNYRQYLSSADYHSLDPIDPLTKRLIDGKLVIPYTIGGRFPQYLPKYYCWILDKNTVVEMNDNPVKVYSGVEDYLNKLLHTVGSIAIKPFTGAGGIGFLKLELIAGIIYANNKKIDDIKEIIDLISNKYLVTEYIHQCKAFDEIWKDSTATLRVITINKDHRQCSFVSHVRFGTKISNGACNLTSGGVAVPFNWESGEYYPYFYRYIDYCLDGNVKMDAHPDSHVMLRGKKVPYFDQVKQLVTDICNFLTVHTYFGFDIMITDAGPKICEINSHPSLDYGQLMFGGIWTQEQFVQDFFKNLLEKK